MTSKEKLEEMTFTELLEGLIKACDIRIEELGAQKKPELFLMRNDD
jgi:hypothetical protein